MFTNKISNLPVWGEGELNLFPNIEIDLGRMEDVVFAAMLRLLVPSRLKDDEKIRFSVVTRSIVDFNLPQNQIIWATQLVNVDETQMPGWKQMADVEKFIYNQIKEPIKIWVNKDKRAAVLQGEFSSRLIHTAAYFIPRYLPDLFGESRLTEREMAVLNTLLKPTSIAFIAIMRDIATEMGLYGIAMARKVANATRQFALFNVRSLEEIVKSRQSEVNEKFEYYKQALKDQNDAVMKLEGARVMAETANEKQSAVLIEFLEENPHIHVDAVEEDGTVSLTIENYLDLYDADGFEMFVPSFFENVARTARWETADVTKLLKATFSADPIFRIRTCGFYRLNPAGWVRTERGHEYNCIDRIPNPHLQMHGCLGQNTASIQECMKNGSLMSAIVQCNASTMSVNVHETGATFSPFCVSLLTAKNKILELADGTHMTPKDALKWLNEREEATAE